MNEKVREEREGKGAKAKKTSIWEEVIADVGRAGSVADSHLLFLGNISDI